MKNTFDWRAIIAFSDSGFVSEDWNWFFSDIQDACAGTGIYVIYAGPQDKQVYVGSKEQPLAVIDISQYYKDYRMGYLFIESGRELQYQEYDPSLIVLQAASKYFGIVLTRDN